MNTDNLKPNSIIQGPIFSEPIRILLATPLANTVKLIGTGVNSSKTYELLLTPDQLAQLTITSNDQPRYDGDSHRFHLGLEALRLQLAYEYDPYYALSIAQIDPLPHQLEAVYDYFLKLPRIRFLLADDPGAGKTIMAGLLIKELKIRGLLKRTLIISPANLTFQWQRELQDKFRETFTIVNGDRLRIAYGSNPWQEHAQIVTSLAWVSRVEEAKKSLLQSHWDLIIVDEAHKMSAATTDKKTLAYKLGESLSTMTDHYLLLTATPHKGDPENFRLFLSLLDKEVYAHISSLEEAMKQRQAPFYLRRVKEALVTFPDSETGQVKTLFTKRLVKTLSFHLNAAEQEFYEALSSYVDEQAKKAKADDNSARGLALGFTLAMLQKRFASSVYAVRRTLERMAGKRQEVLDNPEKFRQAQLKKQLEKQLPEDFDELPEEEQNQLLDDLETVAASVVDPVVLQREVRELQRLIDLARQLESKSSDLDGTGESKLEKLKEVMTQQSVFQDPTVKLLLFTEHKDTLDYLVGKLRSWNLSVTQIHGGMKIGDLNTPNSRLQAEKAFREQCQVLVATEAAGEGINLQFCWLLINYDIPWNPIRLEQRMGRIHRYGQEKDCLIINFVSKDTSEGRVLHRLFERLEKIEQDLDPQQTGKIFNVLGDIFPANQLEKMLRDMYLHNLKEEAINDRIVEQIDLAHFRRITQSALEGLAKRELNLASLFNKTTEAKVKRLRPETIEEFFTQAAPIIGLKLESKSSDLDRTNLKIGTPYRVGKIPRSLVAIAEAQEAQFGKLGRDYQQIIFDKQGLKKNPTLEWVTLGHPLFEAVRTALWQTVQEDLQRGAVFYDWQREVPARLQIFSVAIKDGRGRELHRRLFVVEIPAAGSLKIHPPTYLANLSKSEDLDSTRSKSEDLDSRDLDIEKFLLTEALQPFLQEVMAQRAKETATVAKHLNLSFNAIVTHLNCQWADLEEAKILGSREPGLEGRLKQAEERVEEHNQRWAQRKKELEQEKNCFLSDIHIIAQALVLPHPKRHHPEFAPLLRDDTVEQIAIQAVIAYEQARGCQVKSVETENYGFDLESKSSELDQKIRFIEVKGRAQQGTVALTPNEYKTAQRLGKDYWLYIVFNCATIPEIHTFQDPATTLEWEKVVKVEHYCLKHVQI